jgi:hypothetical protein
MNTILSYFILSHPPKICLQHPSQCYFFPALTYITPQNNTKIIRGNVFGL